MTKFVGAAEPLSKNGFRGVVADLGVGIPELLAVLAVKSRNCEFLPDHRPISVFERHIFHKLSRGRFSEHHPGIRNPVSGGYANLAKEYPWLEKAITFDRDLALYSASWEAGQLMGFNHASADFADAQTMGSAMQQSDVLFGQRNWIELLCWKLQGFSLEGVAGIKVFRQFQIRLLMPNYAIYSLHRPGPEKWCLQRRVPSGMGTAAKRHSCRGRLTQQPLSASRNG